MGEGEPSKAENGGIEESRKEHHRRRQVSHIAELKMELEGRSGLLHRLWTLLMLLMGVAWRLRLRRGIAIGCLGL